MFIQTKQRKLRLLSNNSSITSPISFESQFDSIFSSEAEQRINNWLDQQNIVQQTPEQHFRDFFQQNKDSVQNQINLLIHQQSFTLLPEVEIQSSSSCSSCVNSPNSLDLKKSPILNRRRINLGELLINNKSSSVSSSQSSSMTDVVEEFAN